MTEVGLLADHGHHALEIGAMIRGGHQLSEAVVRGAESSDSPVTPALLPEPLLRLVAVPWLVHVWLPNAIRVEAAAHIRERHGVPTLGEVPGLPDFSCVGVVPISAHQQ